METTTSQVSRPGAGRKWLFYSTVVLIVIVITAIAFYFGYWKKTPQYSLGIIVNAVKKHDVVKFQRHIDLDSLLSRAFDDIMATSMEQEVDADVKSMASGFAQLLKQPLINATKDGIKRYVETGKFEADEQTKPNQPDTNTDKSEKVSSKKIREKAGLSNADFRGFAYTKKDGKTAIVGVKIWEEQVGQEFILDLKMRELDDGTWQLAEIVNLPAYMAKLDAAKMKKLSELNRPIEDQIKKVLTVGQITSRKVSQDMWGFSTRLEVSIPLTFTDDRSVTEIAGNMTVVNVDKQPLFKGTFLSNGTSYKGKNAVIKYSWDLNPFFSGQKAIINTPDDALTKVVAITKIKFSDGTELSVLEELPKSEK